MVRTRQRTANPDFVKKAPPSELHAAGFFTSATGVTIYRGTAYPTEFRGNAFVGDVGGNLVHRKIVGRAGPILSAKRADEGVEFLASTDNWFRPVNFVNTPSGTLLVLDMYRETIEHPASIPDPIKRHLDLTSGHDRGRLYEIVPDGFVRKPARKLAKAAVTELVACLDDPQACNRETAQRLLIERRDDAAVGPLRELAVARRTALGRLHALWTLDSLDRLDSATLLMAVDDPEPNIREQVARLCAPRSAGDENVLKGLIRLAGDDDAAVRFQAALAIGDALGPEATGALAAIARRTARDDPWTRAAILSGLKGRAGDFLARLQETPEFLAGESGRPWLNEVAALVGAEPDRAVVNRFVAAFAGEGADPADTRAALIGLARGLRRSGKRLDTLLEPTLADRLAATYKKAAERAADPSATATARADAIALLELGPASASIEVLPTLLDARQPTAVSLAALSVLNGLADPRVGAKLVEQWGSMGPSVRREAIEVLFARKERRPAILDGLKQGTIRPGDFDPERRRQLLEDPALKDRARELLAGAGPDDRAKVLEAYRPASEMPGDVARGREVHKRVCATCHKAGDQGLAVGPDLATVANRSPQDLIVHILDPNREVAPNFLNYNVETTDGRVLSGMIADESATSLTLKRAEGATDVLPRSQIEAIRSSGQSLMPEGLEKDIQVEQLADLIAFIKSLR
ncbi:MAG: c-type cytochrome [Isosphaeraceae bacterium]